MGSKRHVFAAVIVPGAAFVLAEMGLCALGAGGADGPYMLRLVGLIGLAELGVLVSGAFVVAFLTPRAVALPMAMGLAAFTGVLFAGLLMLGNGLPPVFRLGEHGRAVLIGVALAAALLAGVTRARLATRSRTARPPGILDIVAGPTLLPPAVLATWEVAWHYGFRAGTPLGLVLLLGAGAAAMLAGRLLCRRAGGWMATAAAGLVPLLALAGSVALSAMGRSPFPELPSARTAGPPDVLLIVLDTVRADAAPAPPDAPVPTPTLARLVAEGQTWTRAFSTSAWTVPAHASLFTGLEADEHGSGWESPSLSSELPTLAEQFASAGWRTGGFSSNPYIGPDHAYDRGFMEFSQAGLDRKPRRPWSVHFLPEVFVSIEAAGLYEDKGGLAVASDALHFLAGTPEQPAFVFVNLLEAHLPYRPPTRWMARIESPAWSRDDLRKVDMSRFRGLHPGGEHSAREIEGLRRLYAAAVAHDDELVGRLVGALERAGRLDRAVIAIVGDHGENLAEHRLLDHQLGLWDSLVRVPLILRFPARLAAGVRREAFASLADVAPALRELAGIGTEPPSRLLAGTAGRDLLWFRYGRPVSVLDMLRNNYGLDPQPWDRSLRGVRNADRKWIDASDGRHEAYDLARDPGEENNLFQPGQGPPPGFEALAAALTARRREVRTAAPAAPPAPREDMRRRLRSLGYLP